MCGHILAQQFSSAVRRAVGTYRLQIAAMILIAVSDCRLLLSRAQVALETNQPE